MAAAIPMDEVRSFSGVILKALQALELQGTKSLQDYAGLVECLVRDQVGCMPASMHACDAAGAQPS